MEITGIECSHKQCEERIWDDHPQRYEWLTLHMTSPGYDFDEVVHLCPQHGRTMVERMQFGHAHKPHSGQERVIGNATSDAAEEEAATQATQDSRHIDPVLAQALLDEANDADLARVGVDSDATAPIDVLNEFAAAVSSPEPPLVKQTWEVATVAPADYAPATTPIPVNSTIKQPRNGPKKIPRRSGGRVGGASTVRTTMTGMLMLVLGVLTHRHSVPT